MLTLQRKHLVNRQDAVELPAPLTYLRYRYPVPTSPALGLKNLTRLPAGLHRPCARLAQPLHAQAPDADVQGTISWTGRWWPVVPLDSLDPKIPVQVDLLDKSLVVWADSKGAWHCLEDRCPHRLAPLSEGRIEGDTLMCSYHGWTFGPSGKCTNIPQLSHDPKAQAAACASQRSCAKAYPTRQTRGLLWVWPEAGPEAAQRAEETQEQPALSQEDGQSAWFVRDLPMRYDTLLENLLDPAHVPFAHHGVQGLRTSTFPMGGMGCSKVDVNGFVATTPAPFGDLQVAFKAPFYSGFSAVTKGGQASSQSELFVVPMKPGYVRFMSNFSLDYPHLPQPIRQLTKWRKGMTWLDHILERNTIIDGDNYLLHASERLLPVRNGIGQEALRACYMPAPADSGVVGLRTWIQKHAGAIPTCKPDDEARMPPLLSHREVLDRWEQHTKSCSHCKKALAILDKIQLFAGILGAAAAVVAISEVVASVLLAVANSVPGVSIAGSSLLSAIPWIPVAIALAVVAVSAAVYQSLSQLRHKFFFEDYIHAIK